MKTEVLFVHISKPMKHQMRAVCRRTGQSLSSLTRKVLREHLKKRLRDGNSFEWTLEEEA